MSEAADRASTAAAAPQVRARPCRPASRQRVSQKEAAASESEQQGYRAKEVVMHRRQPLARAIGDG